ncbi:MAG: hypothetical protein IJ155_01950 [Prevotella sp.]|nr:hypothetical protein [Prevotella sp.]
MERQKNILSLQQEGFAESLRQNLPPVSSNHSIPYEEALQRAVRECKLLKDYEHARFVWTLLADMAQRLGTPDALLRKYQDELTEHFEHRDQQDEQSADLPKRLARAVESCADSFWAKSSWAVVFCVCRDCCGYHGSMANFERLAGSLPLSRSLPYPCPEGTIPKTISNNPYMKKHVTKWQQHGGMGRALHLAEMLKERLSARP